MNQLPEELLNRLDTLAAAIGSSTEVLWEALVRGGFAIGVISAIFIPFIFVMLYVSYRFGKASWNYKPRDYLDDMSVFPGMVSMVLLLICSISLPILVGRLVYLVSPEFYAVNRILELLK